ncbi:cytochrome P450 [Nocardiopsis sp. ARC36]
MRITAPGPQESVPLEDIDLFDPERYRSSSQHTAWQTLRARAPMWEQTGPDGSRFWSVTRYDDVLRVIKDHRTFSSEHGTILAVLGGDRAGGKTINLMDPPNHAAIRVPTMRLLSTSVMGGAEEKVRGRVRAIVERCLERDGADLAPLMQQLPMAVVGDIIGVPEELWADVATWTMAGVAPEDPSYLSESEETTLKTAHFELFALFHDLVRERRARPRNDVVSSLLTVGFEGRRLTLEEVVLNCYSFVMGANTTTPHVASQLVLALAEHPGAWEGLRQGTVSPSRAVEEGLRWATPTNHLVRRTTAPVRLADTELDEGELVCAWVASANRDERVFDRPYHFDPTRSPNPHIAFGNGIHYCNGAPGARLVIRLFLEELTAAAEGIEVAGPVGHLYSNFINGVTALPVRVRPAPKAPGRKPVPVPEPQGTGCPVTGEGARR